MRNSLVQMKIRSRIFMAALSVLGAASAITGKKDTPGDQGDPARPPKAIGGLRNADFEAAEDSEHFGWKIPKTGVWRIEPGAGRNGTRGLVYETADTNAPYSWPYQNVRVTGGRTFAYECWMTAEQLRCDKQGGTIFISWRDPDGRKREHWGMGSAMGTTADWMKSEAAIEIPDGVTNICVNLVVRRHAVGRIAFDDVLLRPIERVVRDPDTWPKRTYRGKVHIDEYGRTIVDGKPFFPLGFYCGPLDESNVLRVASSPFNVLLPYARPDDAGMDLAARHGVKVIYSLIDYFVGTRYAPHVKTEADERKAIGEKVARFRHHPALLAWYVSDERPMTLLESLERHARWLQEMDPEHPSFNMIIANTPRVAAEYAPTGDVIGTDPYPIGCKVNSDIVRCAQATKAIVDGVQGRRGVWMAPQVFDWTALFPQWAEEAGARPPTFHEMRNMYWQMIAAGAKGLVAYILKDKSLTAGEKSVADCWRDICAVGQEIAYKFPVLLSVEPAPTIESVPEGVVARAWTLHGRRHLLAVNATRKPAAGEIRLSDGTTVQIDLPALDVRWQ